MTKVTKALLLASTTLLPSMTTSVALAQPAPSGAHPRIWLDAATRQGFQAQANIANSPVKKAAARCAAARQDPGEYAVGGWQGFEFVITLSSCLSSYAATSSADDLATAIKYFNVLLDDYQTVGDGQGGDSVVTHDTGYAMRTFAPYSALAYDWLHDAPGVTETLRAHARARFDAWSTYYSTSGYLKDLPGANYQAGYAFAATLMAVAEGGEAGAAGDAHWANVRDVIWKKDLLPALGPSGVLDGGDWPEGWQYGALSVLEHALGARAMQESGVTLEPAAAWASSLPLRFAHGLTPALQSFTGGDSDATTPYRAPVNGALLAAIAGPASAEARALARKLNSQLALSNENPLFDALAAATSGPEAALSADAPTSYLARGAGNWYLRGGWTPETAWGVFQCSRHVVDDHQYANAGNWVLSRGADDLVVDPSPYGSLSTLTGNAPAVDSASLPAGYSPSQGFWGKKTGLVWTRKSGSGVAVARCDYADQFQRSDVASDVSHALRDFVMVPQGNDAQVVLIDRVVTGGADRSLHLRVRTPSTLALANDVATGTVGASALAIHKVWASSGEPNVRSMPKAAECPSSDHGCDVSKLDAGSEYRIDVTGPSAFAIHVVTAQAGAPHPAGTPLSGVGYRGVLVDGATSLAVVGSDDAAAAVPAELSYRAPAGKGAVHVVVDAPVSANGESDVTAALDGADCKVTVKPHTGAQAGLPGRPLVLRVQSDCSFQDDGSQKQADPGSGDPGGSAASGAGGGGNLSPGAGSGAVVVGASGGAGSSGSSPQPSQGGPQSDSSCALRPGRLGNARQRGAGLSAGLVVLGASRLRRRRRAKNRRELARAA